MHSYFFAIQMRGHIMNISWALILLLSPIWFDVNRAKKHFYRNHKRCQFQFKYHNWSGKREQRMCITKHFISFSVAPFFFNKKRNPFDLILFNATKKSAFYSWATFPSLSIISIHTQREMCGFFHSFCVARLNFMAN